MVTGVEDGLRLVLRGVQQIPHRLEFRTPVMWDSSGEKFTQFTLFQYQMLSERSNHSNHISYRDFHAGMPSSTF